MEHYVEYKTDQLIHVIKDTLAEYLAIASRKEFLFLEYVMQKQVYLKGNISHNFFQEMVRSQESATFRINMQKYINENAISTAEVVPQFVNNNGRVKQKPYIKDGIERVVDIVEADIGVQKHLTKKSEKMSDKKQPPINLVKRLFVLTNQGIQVMKPLDAMYECPKCKDTDPSCPTGPT